MIIRDTISWSIRLNLKYPAWKIHFINQFKVEISDFFLRSNTNALYSLTALTDDQNHA